MRWPVALSVLVACAPLPPPPNSGFDPSQIDTGAFVSARSGTLRMQLGTPPQIQLPIILVASPDDMTNLLAAPPTSDECIEGYAGVNLYPAARASASTTVGMSTVTTVLAGPAVARFVVEYSVPYDCQGMRTLSGKSTFTMLPSGRIERVDENVVATTTPIPSSTNCGCNTTSAAQFFFGSFWSFKSAAELTPTDSPRNMEQGPGCTVFNGQTIAVDFDNPEQRGENGTHLIYFTVTDPPFNVTQPQSAHSSIAVVQGSSCADALKRLVDPKIQIDGNDVGTVDGIYVVSADHPSGVEVKTNFPIPNGFGLQVPLGGATHARVLKDGLPLTYVSEIDGDQPLFWFADAFMPNETITIDPVD